MRNILILLTLMAADALAQKATNPDATTLFTVAPAISLVSGTKQQQTYTGNAILSHVNSHAYCDVDTTQLGVLASASDSITKSGTSPAIAVVSDDFGGDFLHGILAGRKTATDANGQPTKTRLTQNFASLTSHFFINNSLGVGLQQSYVAEYQRYLRPCQKELVATVGKRAVAPVRFFSSVGIGAGYTDQRLYATTPHTRSTILPLSAQFTYLWPSSDEKNPPKGILSAQIGYTPFLNDLHAYQISEAASFQIPTGWTNVSLTLQQTDLYMNNAPHGFKRNYQTEGILITFTIPKSKPSQSADVDKGACYTADKSSHLYCYNAETKNACLAPSIFRPRATCSTSGIYVLRPSGLELEKPISDF
jgi:hypothetical protein